jgi:hypothetical protein
LRAAARLAERAALTRQRRDWASSHHDHKVISRLGVAAQELEYAADRFGLGYPDRRRMTSSLTFNFSLIVLCAAGLLIADEPAHPGVLAGTVTLAMICASAMGNAAVHLSDRLIYRSAAKDDPSQDAETFADLYRRVELLAAEIGAVQTEPHRAAAKHIEEALVWISAAAVVAMNTPRHDD